MQTKVSTKGQVRLPASVRRKLGLRPGDSLDVKTSNGSVVLTPKKSRRKNARIVIDPVSGLPVLEARAGLPLLTSEQVEEMLADFP